MEIQIDRWRSNRKSPSRSNDSGGWSRTPRTEHREDGTPMIVADVQMLEADDGGTMDHGWYQIAQMYMVMKMQQQSSTGPEGVEVLENRPFEADVYGRGQFTSKIYRLQSKAPAWLRTFAPADALVMQEEAWNAYPRCKTVIKCPYFTKFSLTIETVHKADNGHSENVHNLSKEQLAARQVEVLDIASTSKDYWSYAVGTSNIEFSKFKSKRTDRGPLLEGWQDRCNPVMTAYKLVTVEAPYWGFGCRVEQALLAGERALFLESHRNCFGWIDEWFELTLQKLRELELQSDSTLNARIGNGKTTSTETTQDFDRRIHPSKRSPIISEPQDLTVVDTLTIS
ncbi:hypothetical protein Dsin_020135 [Dipteronia sinensis]|uniref:Phosphatidylinositol transfer protein N-terminal domain-containing protein n=1 Tax=Dipteronia sinensis TaxID=43782 RepID=A0AAE0A9G8_9ROSI|nr:hypothetical protein Dsin_020135 [Dipteronia sinensis]